jgi:hypothetical protein
MEAGSGHEDSSHNILTLDALQVLSRSQVPLELSMSMRIQPICNLHTYILQPLLVATSVLRVLKAAPDHVMTRRYLRVFIVHVVQELRVIRRTGPHHYRAF